MVKWFDGRQVRLARDIFIPHELNVSDLVGLDAKRVQHAFDQLSLVANDALDANLTGLFFCLSAQRIERFHSKLCLFNGSVGSWIVNVRHAGGLELFAVLARESLGALARETVHLVDTFASVVARIISAVVRVRFAVRSFESRLSKNKSDDNEQKQNTKNEEIKSKI